MKILKRGDLHFPKRLEELKDCPDILYVLGNEKILNDFSIAVIGARLCSIEGRAVAKEITKRLTLAKINIISGLAVGIDSIAHSECINHLGKTIAVLGGGFEEIYPRQNLSLCEKIIENGGAIISEYLPDEAPLKIKFHMRNRIIAALSRGVVVIEAREKSGSLVTVKFARKLNRNIFVVPGNINDDNYKR